MFEAVREEIRGMIWAVRCKFGSTAAAGAAVLAGYAINRMQAGRRAGFSRRAAAALFAVAQRITPPVITEAAAELTNRQFTPPGER